MLVASRLQAKIMTMMIGGCLVLLEEQPTVGCCSQDFRQSNDHGWLGAGAIGGTANCWMLVASRLQAKIPWWLGAAWCYWRSSQLLDVGSFQTSGKDNDHDDWGLPSAIGDDWGLPSVGSFQTIGGTANCWMLVASRLQAKIMTQLLDVGSFQTSGKDNDLDDWGLPGVIGGAANCWMLVASRLQAKIMTMMIGGCLVLLEEQPTVGCW